MISPTAVEHQAQPTFREYLYMLQRWWWLIAAAAVAGLVLALMLSVAADPVYRGSTRVVVGRAATTTLGLLPDLTGASQNTYVETLAQIIKSRAVTDLAADKLGVPPDERPRVTRELRRGLDVLRVRGTDIIEIRAEGPTPDRASANANALADAFLQWNVDARRAQASAGRQFIEGQLSKVADELRAAENALAQFKASGGQAALSEQTTIALTRIADFEAQRRAATAERQAAEASLQEARRILGRQEPILPIEDPVAVQLRTDLARLETELASLRQQFTERHPQVVAAQARVTDITQQLRQLASARLAGRTVALNPLHQTLATQAITLEVQREALLAKERAMAGIVNQYIRDARTLPAKEVRLAGFMRNLKIAEDTYLLLSAKLQEARIAEASIVSDASVVDRAVPQGTPIRPRPALNALIGLLVGLLVGAGAGYGLGMWDTTFKSPEEVERVLGLPVLAAIPAVPTGRPTPGGDGKKLLMPIGQRRAPFAEAFRHLRTSLLYISPDTPLRSIEITSPGPGEGKSTISSNLSVAFAEAGKEVWLVECDLRKPVLALTFQPKTNFGLTELLVDGLSIEHAVQKTEFEHLSFVPSGTTPPNPAELLGSQKMRTFLQHSHNGAEMMILDAPPVLPVTDAAVLAPAVDGVVLVVRIDRTPRDAARRARQQLDAVGARVLGVVVNGMPVKGRGTSYYYAYSEYYDSDSEGKKAAPPVESQRT